MHPENNIGDVMKAKIDSKNSVLILIVKALFNEILGLASTIGNNTEVIMNEQS